MSMSAAPLASTAAQLDTDEQLLHNIAALEEVENCSTLVLQELLQHKPFVHPSHLHTGLTPLPHAGLASATRQGVEKQSHSSLQQVLHLHQVSQPHQPSCAHHQQQHSQSHNNQHSRPHIRHHQHPMQYSEGHPHLNFQQLAHKSSVSLLDQALECSILSSSGLVSSGALVDHFAVNGKGMTLPALCSAPLPSKKSSVSARRRANNGSLGRASKKTCTFSAQFSPSDHDTIHLSVSNGLNSVTPMCAEPKKAIPATHFLTERQRREFLNEKYQVLRSLIPNPTKADRASIVQDAIDYVNELKDQVETLHLEKGSRDLKRRKVVDNGMDSSRDSGEATSCERGQHLAIESNGAREGKTCTRAHMTSKYGTEIDVRVMNDEATIRVTQHWSQDSFLLVAALMLHEAQLELLHASGARIGNSHVYMLNVKISEGSVVGAGQIAKCLLGRIDLPVERTHKE